MAPLALATGLPSSGLPAGQAPSATSTTTVPSETPPAPIVSLLRQPAWTRIGGTLPMRLHVTGDAAGRALRFSLYGRLSSRSAFELTTLGQGLGSATAVIDRPLEEKSVSDAGEVVVRIGLRGPDDPRDPDRLPISMTGVHPLRVELVDSDSGEVLSDFVTWLVAVADDPVDAPLAFSWIWRVSAPPLWRADDSPEPSVLAQMEPGGRLDVIAGLLAEARGVPLSLALSPETLESWRVAAREHPELTAGYSALSGGASRDEHQLLPAPYVPIEVPAIEADGLGEELLPELIAGSDTLERLLGRRVDPRTAFVDPVDPAAIDRLRSSFVDRVVVQEESLLPSERNLTPARPFSLATGSLDVVAASTNPGLYSLLEGDLADALLAQRFLAGVSLVALEAPAEHRGLVFVTPKDWNARPETTSLVLEGLREHPLLDPRTLDDYFAAVPSDTFDDSAEPLIRLLAPIEPGELPITGAQLTDARLTLDSFRSVVGAGDDRIRRGEQALLTALTTEWSSERATAELAMIYDDSSSFLSGISMTDQSVTVTSKRANVPLSFVNDTGRPVRVRVHLESSKLVFPEGSDRVVELAEGNTTERFLLSARANGTFTMTVTLTSEDGRLPVGSPASITVNATVFSGVGAFLTIGAVLFLAGWWANHIWRSRKERRRHGPPAPAAPGAPPQAS